MRKITKLALAVTAGVVSVGAISFAVSAFWTAPGTGTGESGAGGNIPITVMQTGDIVDLAPGSGVAMLLSGTFVNANESAVHVNTLTATIGTVTKAGGAPAGTCDATDFAITGGTMAIDKEVPKTTNNVTWPTSGTPSIGFVNKLTNQDACKGATVTLSYVVS